MRASALSIKRNENGNIIQENPLVAYLKQNRIRTGNGYRVLGKELGEEGRQLRYDRYAWLDELILLPIDHRKEPEEYAAVVKTIKSFFEINRKV